jgi:hypothetical protein
MERHKYGEILFVRNGFERVIKKLAMVTISLVPQKKRGMWEIECVSVISCKRRNTFFIAAVSKRYSQSLSDCGLWKVLLIV